MIETEDLPEYDAKLAEEVVAALAGKLGKSPQSIRLDDDLLRDLGIDSMSMAEMTVSVEQAAGARIPGNELLDVQTVGDLVRLLSRYSHRSAPPESAGR